MPHGYTKRLPLPKGHPPTQPREYLFVAIDDFSRALYADILPDKAQDSAARFLANNVLAQCPYQVGYAYPDNGKEYKGAGQHAFVKAERVIRTLMQMWHNQHTFKDCQNRRPQLGRFINFYNTAKPHKSWNNSTPYEILY